MSKKVKKPKWKKMGTSCVEFGRLTEDKEDFISDAILQQVKNLSDGSPHHKVKVKVFTR